MINGLTIDEIDSIGNFIEAMENLVIRMCCLDVCEPSMSVTLIEWEEPQTYGFVQQERGLAGSISYNVMADKRGWQFIGCADKNGQSTVTAVKLQSTRSRQSRFICLL